MTKSRMGAGLAALAGATFAVPVEGQTADLDRYIEAQRAELRVGMRLDCPPASNDDEIIVCGARDEDRQHRLSLPAESAAQSADRAGGEQRAALGADSSRCTAVGRDQQCSGGLDLVGAGAAILKVAERLLTGDD